MILMVLLSAFFFLTIFFLVASGIAGNKNGTGPAGSFLPKSRSEMIKGIAAIAIVFSHIATYSKGAAPSGILRYYNVFCTTLGGIGVNLFFFLSGYGNYFSVLKNKDQKLKWLGKRCATLLIVYLVCFFVVLAGLYATGYRTTVSGVLNELLHLTIPYSSVWYVKIQLLVYIFLVIAVLLSQRKHQIMALTALCLLSSVILFCCGLNEKWWKSTLCFALGAFVAAYKSEIEELILRKRKAVLLGCFLAAPPAFVCAVLVDFYPVKTIGNAVLCLAMMGIFQLLEMENRIYAVIGGFSLTLYLTHRSFVAWTLDDGKTTVLKVALIVVVSAVMTLIAQWISNALIKRCFGRSGGGSGV